MNVTLLSKKRDELYGIAIVMVLLYHLYCWPFCEYKLSLFQYFYGGVDIFILLSGFGLCFSYERNSLGNFYKRRLLRLLPLYYVSYFLSLFINRLINGGDIDICFADIFYRLTTLNYWGFGRETNTWYVEALIILYLLFPLVFYLVKKSPILVFFLLGLIAMLLLKFMSFSWQHNCLVARLPVFGFGILCYLYYTKVISSKVLYSAFLLSILMWIIGISYSINRFFYTSTIVPLLVFYFLYLLAANPNIVNPKITSGLTYLGKHSYELFLSNGLTYVCLNLFSSAMELSMIARIVIYGICSLVFGFFYILVQRIINHILRFI